MDVRRLRVKRVYKAMKYAELRERVKKIREHSVRNLKELVEKARESFESKGFEVFLAKNIEEARKFALKFLEDCDVIVKSKTNVGREIGITPFLREHGKEVFETDCGDFLVDLANKKPVYSLDPAIGVLSLEEIEELLQEREPEKIKEKVRAEVSKAFERACAGISGANFFTSSGEILLVENEGNIAKVVTREKVLFVTSIEKVVEGLENAFFCAVAQSLFATGRVASYIHVVSGLSGTGDLGDFLPGMHGAREAGIILLDNGRSSLLGTEFEQILRCINCGLCTIVCPIFPELGFELGGVRGVLLQKAQKSKEELFQQAFRCTLCGLCSKLCPACIELDKLMLKLREELVELGFQTEANKKMLENLERFGNTVGEEVKGNEAFYCC